MEEDGRRYAHLPHLKWDLNLEPGWLGGTNASEHAILHGRSSSSFTKKDKKDN